MFHTFTLIIPHYNIPDKLRRLLCTIPKRNDLQIIVVDDSSTKNLSELEEVKRDFPFVEFYSTISNGGGGKARNIGMLHMTGDYIMFADADDYFLPELERVIDKYRVTKEMPDIIFCNAISVYDETEVPSSRTDHLNRIFKILPRNPKKAQQLFKFSFGEPWCKIIKRSVIIHNNIRFEEIPIHNDTKFSYLIGFYSNDIAYHSIPIYTVIDRKNSTSKAVNWKYLAIRTCVFANKKNFFVKHGINYRDPITFNPLLIAILNFRIDKFKEFIQIYQSYNISQFASLIGCMYSLRFYILRKFSRIFTYLSLEK